jgi:glycosyltransferase involved in cell wall biosynthesis
MRAVVREEALRHLRHSYALVHPSLHDSGGLVCLEAMAAGKPIICLKLGGPAQQVQESCGILVDACSSDEAVLALAEAMKRLAKERQLSCKMGMAGIERVKSSFVWSSRTRAIAGIYTDVLRSNPDHSQCHI